MATKLSPMVAFCVSATSAASAPISPASLARIGSSPE